MEQSPSWESNSQGTPYILWNPKVHYRVDKSPLLIPILSQMHPVQTLPTYFRTIHSSVIFPSTPRSSK
jgi:hypothetical protein